MKPSTIALGACLAAAACAGIAVLCLSERRQAGDRLEALATRVTVLEARDVRPGDGAHSSSLGILESTASVVFLTLEAELDPGYPEQRPIEEMLGLSTRADWLNFCEAFEDGRLEAT